jgi:hypothetical protein
MYSALFRDVNGMRIVRSRGNPHPHLPKLPIQRNRLWKVLCLDLGLSREFASLPIRLILKTVYEKYEVCLNDRGFGTMVGWDSTLQSSEMWLEWD